MNAKHNNIQLVELGVERYRAFFVATGCWSNGKTPGLQPGNRGSIPRRSTDGGLTVTKVLERPTLVLNRNWQPVNVATVARALTMLWNESARVVDPESFQLYGWNDWSRMTPDRDEPFIQAVRVRFRVPEVIALTEFDRMPAGAVTFSRRNVFKRDRFTCQYCNQQPGSGELTIDHVIPRSHGGETSWTNCVLACLDCNSRKADRTPEQAKMRLRNEPTRPAWRPVYADHAFRMDSWSKFISEAYWNVELKS